MEIISGLINTPKSQSAEEIIPTLCDRLAHASLASDKRAAVLTLKGFSRQYRESVIANGLRGLINTLKTFTIDTEIVKACLETLLILFIRGEGDDDMTRSWISQQSRVQNGKYPSPLLMKEESNTIDQFSLWIADEVTQEDGTISLILSLLDNPDFYVRMYTLQLLEALVSMRPLRAKEAVLHAPLGISSLIQVLEDTHDPVRNEAVLLLMAIANDNFNIQKLIAFENTFDRLFEIIHEEGDIRGSIVVQDCLSLIANLLKYNASNQQLFLETNCLPKLAYLISEPLSGEEIIWNDQRLQNVIIALDIVKLFVIEGNESTKQNQDILFNADIFIHVLRLSFSELAPNSLRSIALLTTADLIDRNADLQFKFSSIDVPYIDPSLPQPLRKHSGHVPVVIALLNWCLYVNSVHLFDIRVAAAHLLVAYFKNNKEAKIAFVQDQIAAYRSTNSDEIPNGELDEGEQKEATPASAQPDQHPLNGESSTNGSLEPHIAPISGLKAPPIANLFQTLLEYDPEIRLNPYKIWFSSVILLSLFEDEDEIKETVREITTGDEGAGEEVLTSIQAISDVLVTTLTFQDPRTSIGYLMLLIVWLYEDFDAVNDFLSELSTVKALMSYLKQPTADSGIVQGLITVLLGVSYEFSSKKSPITRVEYHSLIVKMIGKDNYSLKVRQFKESEHFADFSEEAIYNPKRDESGLPEVFFDPVLVSLLKENFNRIKNTLNKDPTLESNGRISFEKFEELQDTYHALKHTFDELQSNSKAKEEELKLLLQKTEKELKDSIEAYSGTSKDLSLLQEKHSAIIEELQAITKELTDLKQAHSKLSEASIQHQKDLQESGGQLTNKDSQISRLQDQLAQTTKQKEKAEEGINKMSRELFLLSKEKDESSNKVQQLEKESQNAAKQTQKLQDTLNQKLGEIEKLKFQLDSVNTNVKKLDNQKSQVEQELNEVKSQNDQNLSHVNQLSEKLRGLANTCNQLASEKGELEAFVSELQKNSSIEVAQLKSKSQELTELNSTLDAAKLKLVEDLKTHKEKFENERLSLQETNAKLQKENEALQKRFLELEKELQDTKEERSHSSNKLKEVHDLLEKTKSDFKLKENTHAEQLSSQKKSFEDEKLNLENKQSELIKSHTSELQLVKEELEMSKSTNLSLNKELSLHKDESSSSQETLAAKAKEIEDFKLSVGKLNTELEDLATSKVELEKELENVKKSLSDERASFEKDREELLKSKQDLEVELDDLAVEYETKEHDFKKEINTLKEKVGSLEEEKKSLESTLEMISQNIEGKAKEYEILSKDFKVKQSEHQKVSDDLERALKEKTELETSFQDQRNQIDELEKKHTSKLESVQADLEVKDSALKSLEKKIESQKSKHKAQISDFEAEIEALKSNIESKVQDFEKERSLLSENSSSATKEYSDRVSKLEEKIQAAEKDSFIKLADLEKEKAKLEEKIAELDSQIDSLTSENSSKNKKLEEFESKLELLTKSKKESDSALNSATKEAKKVSGLETQIKNLEAKITDLENEATEKGKISDNEAKKSEEAKLKLEANHKELKNIEVELSTLKSRSESASKSAKEALERSEKKIQELESSKKELSDKVTDLNSKLDKSESEFNREILASKNKLDDSQKSLSKLTEEVIKEKEKATTAISESDAKLAKSSEEIENLREENLSLKSSINSEEELKKALGAATNETERLQKELKELKSKTVPKSDLDDLMLVLDEMDESKKKYKTKAKELGGDVSSDDESEDEEESGEE